jgi:hypothetical protein
MNLHKPLFVFGRASRGMLGRSLMIDLGAQLACRSLDVASAHLDEVEAVRVALQEQGCGRGGRRRRRADARRRQVRRLRHRAAVHRGADPGLARRDVLAGRGAAGTRRRRLGLLRRATAGGARRADRGDPRGAAPDARRRHRRPRGQRARHRRLAVGRALPRRSLRRLRGPARRARRPSCSSRVATSTRPRRSSTRRTSRSWSTVSCSPDWR